MATNQANYSPSTPYYLTDVVNNNYLDVMNFRFIPKNPTDIYMTITPAYEYRPDKLALDLYNDPRLWWVFAARNPNRLGDNPYFNFVSGTGIYIPTMTTLISYLGI